MEHSRMWHLVFSVQLVLCNHVFLQLAHKCNSLLLKKVLHADISLSSRTYYSCWTSHLLSALDGLAHSDLMRHQIMACNPVNLSQLVVDLRSRHLNY
eukprot:1160217-Pelagomonas_calceolata.AAC.24